MNFFKKKSFYSVKETGESSGLVKSLTSVDLIFLGLGAIIGSGAFVLTGSVAAQHSGPAVMLSYAIAGVTCIFVALAYTELAAMLPTSGSIYTYSYVAFGEIVAWLVGGVMILELSLGMSTVAAGWSGYVQTILASGGIVIPKALGEVPSKGGIMNLPAMLVVCFIGFMLYRGTKDSKKLNAALVVLKMGAIAAFIITAAPHFDATNWEDFMPYGFDDVVIGASVLFFAFTGFGTLATAAEECKNPKRDLTIGIIVSLVLSTVVYITIGGLVTGIVPYTELDNAQPLAHALNLNGLKVGSAIVAVGAVCGMTSVMMMQLFGVSRIFYVMARDGLLPKYLAKLHPKHDSPYLILLAFVIFNVVLTGFFPYEILGKLSSMGSLLDYIIIIAIVGMFRFTMPMQERPFKCPAAVLVIPAAIIACIYLLMKQVIAPSGGLLLTGKIIIIFFAVLFAVYTIGQIYRKVKN